MKTITITFLSFIACISTIAQIAHSQGVYQTLKANDSLLFDIGFNNCDMQQFESLISEDFEFYHDQAGVTDSKSAFIKALKKTSVKSVTSPEGNLNDKIALL